MAWVLTSNQFDIILALSGMEALLDHDSLSGFVGNEHINHTAVSISAGGILSGGGDISANRTISLAHGDVDHDQTANYAANEHFTEASIDHGSIAGLNPDDDHPQYALVTGARAFTGDITISETSPSIIFDDTDAADPNDWAAVGKGADNFFITMFDASGSSYVNILTVDIAGDIDVANSVIVHDEDNMGSDDAAALATQQSIKAYCDGVGFSVTTNYDKFILGIPNPITAQVLMDWLDETCTEVLEQAAEPDATEYYPGFIWIDTDADPALGTGDSISDGDGDTKVQCEEGADEDIVRIDAGGSEIWVGTSDGYITKPLLPSCIIGMSGHQTNHATGAEVTVAFDTEIIDRGADFATSTYIFTAPVDGLYAVCLLLDLGDFSHSMTYYYGRIVTSNRTYQQIMSPTVHDSAGFWYWTMAMLVDAEASDTIKGAVYQTGGAAGVDLRSGCTMSIHLVA